MLSRLVAYYPHRRNRDGSFDSICLTCFATLATARTEPELLEHERNHNCKFSTPSRQAFDRKMLEGKMTPH
jgi:hypothetical protein